MAHASQPYRSHPHRPPRRELRRVERVLARCGRSRPSSVEGPPDGAYDEIGVVGTARLELQRLGSGTPSRIHLDIETDDVEAETVRLVGLGATVVAEPAGYRILTDPGGLLLCVVPVQTDAFATEATTWP